MRLINPDLDGQGGVFSSAVVAIEEAAAAAVAVTVAGVEAVAVAVAMGVDADSLSAPAFPPTAAPCLPTCVGLLDDIDALK